MALREMLIAISSVVVLSFYDECIPLGDEALFGEEHLNGFDRFDASRLFLVTLALSITRTRW